MSTSGLKDLTSILKTYFSPIRSSRNGRRTGSNRDNHVMISREEELMSKAEMLVSQLGQDEPNQIINSNHGSTGNNISLTINSTEQALREKTMKGLMGSLIELGQELTNETDQIEKDEDEDERYRLSSTLLVVLDQLYTDKRARELVVKRLKFNLMKFWWSNLLRPCLIHYPHQLESQAKSALENLIHNELISEGSEAEEKEIEREREESESDRTNQTETHRDLNSNSRKTEIEIIKSNEEIKISEELFKLYCSCSMKDDDSNDSLFKSQLSHEPLLQSILLKWGRQEAKDYFKFLNPRIQLSSSINHQPNPNHHRLVGLTLLIDMITTWPYAIHELLNTNVIQTLLDDLIRSDLNSSSFNPQLIQLIIRSILIIFPRSPTCFDRYFIELLIGFAQSVVWLSKESADESLRLSVLDYFNLLYGLFPFHFLQFLQNPTSFLKSIIEQKQEQQIISPLSPSPSPLASTPTSTLFQSYPHHHQYLSLKLDHSLIKQFTIPLLIQHRLCPALIESNLSNERTHIANQLKLFESAELIQKCEENLIITSLINHQLSNPPLDLLTHAIKHTLGLNSNPSRSRRRSLPTDIKSSDLPASPSPSRPINQLCQRSNQELRTQTLILKTQLNIELYLKQQHLQQMGTLHKQNILGTGLEAEISNLHTINRELRRKLEIIEQADSTKLEQDLKHKTNTNNYHQLIKDRTARYREEKIELSEEKKQLLNKINVLENLLECQSHELKKVETEAHGLRNELKLTEPKLESLDELQTKNEALTKALLTWDDDLRRFRESRKQIDVLRGEWKKFESLANRAELDNQALKLQLKQQTEQNQRLEALLEATKSKNDQEKTQPDRIDREVIQNLEEELRLSEEKNLKLQIELHDLKHQRRTESTDPILVDQSPDIL